MSSGVPVLLYFIVNNKEFVVVLLLVVECFSRQAVTLCTVFLHINYFVKYFVIVDLDTFYINAYYLYYYINQTCYFLCVLTGCLVVSYLTES